MSRVRSGLEVFLDPSSDRAGLPRGARIGLLAHPASVDAGLRHAADLLAARDDLRLVRLFGPEHGVRGEAQDMEAVDAATDAPTGLPAVSLYGSSPDSLRPRPADLDGLDAVVYDLQDVGSRYYTFVYTLTHVLEAAADAGLPVVVLDRPNPLGGRLLEGPVLDPALSSFVGRHPVPVRHGMTPGELAGMWHAVLGIGRELRVIPMEGWRRRMDAAATGLPWVAPSPNMPTPATARVYPGGCLVEGTNLSEGRGTTLPFELVGAPWLPGRELAAALAAEGLPGVLFRAASFRPMFHKHAGTTCSGLQVHPTDPDTFRPFATGLVLLREARRLAPEFAWRREVYEFEADRLAIDLLLGVPWLRPMMEAGAPLREMEASWSEGLARFARERERFLLYPD